MASTVWKGYLTFGMVSVPVRMYAAARPETIHFHMLHKTCGARIKQQLWCPVDETVVDRKDIVKGYEIDEGRYVTVDDEDLKRMEPPAAHTIDIISFVPRDALDPVYFDTSYYLVADDAGQKAYALLQSVLDEVEHDGLARLVMHQREHVVIIRPALGGLMLHTFFYEDEVKKVEGFGGATVKVSERELEMGRQFVRALTSTFDPAEFHDEYRGAVVKMLLAKAKGKNIPDAPRPAPVHVMDLMAALKASIEQGAERSPQKSASASQEGTRTLPRKPVGRHRSEHRTTPRKSRKG